MSIFIQSQICRFSIRSYINVPYIIRLLQLFIFLPGYSSIAFCFYFIKVGFKGVYISWTCFPDTTGCDSSIGCVPHSCEPQCNKTSLQGFRPGPTQTDLHRHRRKLEA